MQSIYMTCVKIICIKFIYLFLLKYFIISKMNSEGDDKKTLGNTYFNLRRQKYQVEHGCAGV